MHIKSKVFLLFGFFSLSLFISSCCQYAKVEYRTCDCKSYFSDLQESFYFDEETGKRKIIATAEEDITRFMELVKSNTKCFKGLGIKGVEKILGTEPDLVDEKLNKISYNFTTDLSTKKIRLHSTPLIISYASTANEIFEIYLSKIDARSGYYQYTLMLLSEDRAPKK